MIAWTVYAALVGILVAGSAWAAERLMGAAGRPTRIPWLAGLGLALVIPGVARPAPVDVPTQGMGGALGPGTAPEPAAVVGPPIDAWALAGLLALSGLALVWVGTVIVAIMRARRAWSRERVAGAEVLVSRSFGPALVGVMRPAIVLPAWALELEPARLEMIVRHEAEHRRARDHLVLLFGGVMLALLVWSPAVWWMFHRLRAAVEIDCDRRVLGSGVRLRDYGSTLLDVGTRAERGWGFVPALTEPCSLLERRLRTMGEGGKKLGSGAAAALACGAGLLLVMACETPAPTGLQEVFDGVLAESDPGSMAEALSGEPRIYVDGVRVEEGLTDLKEGRLLSGLHPGAIERVEVIKGDAARRLYGPDANAGVIQIYLKKTGDAGTEAEKAEVRRLRDQTRTALQLVGTELEAARATADAGLEDLEKRYEDLASQYYALQVEEGQIAESAARALARAEALDRDRSAMDVVKKRFLDLQRRTVDWWRERTR